MKLLELSKVEQQTLREMGILHEHYRNRMRAQAILRLSQGLTLQQTADEFMVHINSIEPQPHRQRVNVLGALRHNGELIWRAQQTSTVRDDVIAFFDSVADLLLKVPRLVVIDNAAIHKGDAIERKRSQWAKKGLYLNYLPAHSPEVNRIEILWKQAKYFWRHGIFGAALH
jgi:transposase